MIWSLPSPLSSISSRSITVNTRWSSNIELITSNCVSMFLPLNTVPSPLVLLFPMPRPSLSISCRFIWSTSTIISFASLSTERWSKSKRTTTVGWREVIRCHEQRMPMEIRSPTRFTCRTGRNPMGYSPSMRTISSWSPWRNSIERSRTSICFD